MFYPVVFFIELFFLFLFSQILSKVLSQLFYFLTRSESITINLLSLMFLPGVILHELAHWFMASILFVPTGEIEFLPQIQGETVKLGSVAIARTDPFRRFIIGVAPVLVGLFVLFMLFYYFSTDFPALNWQTVLLLYFSFEIGNTMFSSKKDMEGAVVLLATCIILAIICYILGFRVSVETIAHLFSDPVMLLFQHYVLLLLVPLSVDVMLVGLVKLLLRKHY